MFSYKLGFQASLLASAIALTGCGSDSDSSSNDNGPGAGREGTAVSGLSISAKGGSSTLGRGGSGGNIDIYKTNSPANLNIVKQGNIDASYTLPAQTPEFGTNPVTITETQTIELVTDSILPGAGTLYMVPNHYRLYRSTGEGTLTSEANEVTGLTVNAGVNLFLPANNGSSSARLYFDKDIQNNGTITTVNGSIASRVDLYLYPAAYYGSGDINLKGETANQYRQSGGDIYITAYTIQNSGLFNTSGANKSSENTTGNGGGNAGVISLSAEVFIENTGELRANGGHSDSDSGTNGADITLNAMAVINTGSINSNSGTGTTSNYSSNSSDIALNAARDIINTGTISSLGANAIDSGNAGRGGDIRFYLSDNEFLALDQRIINTGDLLVTGGSITGDSSGRAGYGGYIGISKEEPDEERNAPLVFEISGNLNADGGSSIHASSYAGNGGSIDIENWDYPTSSAETFLIGYDSINTSGGNGIYAGSAGDIEILFEDYREERSGYYMPTVSGAIYNDVDLISQGGSTIATEQPEGEPQQTGSGNDGGYVQILADNYSAYLTPGKVNVTNSGVISVNGGNSFDNSSRSTAEGGEVYIGASHNVVIDNTINMFGGNDDHVAAAGEGSNHSGSNAGSLNVYSIYGKTNIDSAINGQGGKGDRIGGHGGFVSVNSKQTATINGSINLSGANTVESEVDGIETDGGDAGQLMVVSKSMDSKLNATLVATAGTGDATSEERIVYVDADCLSNNCQQPGPR